MAMQSDKDGFLIGTPIGDAEALQDIRKDTRQIVQILTRGTPARRNYGQPAVTPVTPTRTRADVSIERLRDSRGRFMAQAQAERTPRAREAAERMATTADRMTAAVEKAAKREEVDRALKRGSDGRFTSKGGGSGGGNKPGGSGGGAMGRMLSFGRDSVGGMGVAAHDAGQLDPMIGAANEIGSVLGTVGRVVQPLGRAALGVAGMVGGGLGGGAGDKPVGWLKRMWRELRAMRAEDAQQGKRTVEAIKGQAAGQGGGSGGAMLSAAAGMLSTVRGAVSSMIGSATEGVGKLLTTAMASASGGVVAKVVAGAATGVTAVLKRLPVIGAAIEGGMGLFNDRAIANDETLTAAQKATARGDNAISTAMKVGFGAIGGVTGTAFGPAGTVAGAAGGAWLGSKVAEMMRGSRFNGWVSSVFEGGKDGVASVSSGKGDAGGVSYGRHQLSTNRGAVQDYLAQSKYGAQFKGLTPGTKAFSDRWKQIAGADAEGFGADQAGYVKRKYSDPMSANLLASGIDLRGRGEAVQEMLTSTAVQYGANSDVIRSALKGMNVAGMSDAQITQRVQASKLANVDRHFRSSSPEVRAGVANRIKQEAVVLNAVATAPTTPASTKIPQTPAIAALPAMASVDIPLSTPASASDAVRVVSVPAPAPITQDVPDRWLAHVVTGGIGGGVHGR